MVTHFAVIFITIFVTNGAAGMTSPAVNMTATPPSFMRVLDRSVEVTCTLPQVNGSDLRAVISLIVSRAEVNDTDNLYTEIASITEYDRQTVTLRDTARGAEASGRVVAGEDPFVTLMWRYPNSSVAGKYRCEALAVDKFGHPKTFVGVVTLVERPVDIATALDTVRQLYGRLDACDSYQRVADKLLDACHGPGVMGGIRQHGGHYYLLKDVSRTSVTDARSVCVGYGGYLAQVDDREEYAFIQDLITKKFGTADKWIHLGATDEGHEGSWTYLTSGDPVTFTDWGPSTSASSNYNCMYMHLQVGEWRMEDGGCKEASHGVLCEIDV